MSSGKGTSGKKSGISVKEEQVFNRLPLGILMIDGKGTIRFMNGQLADQMKVGSADLLDTMIFDILEPSCIPDVLSILRSDNNYSSKHTLILNPPSGRSVHGAFSFEEYPLKGGNGFLMVLLEQRVRVMKREIGFEALEELPVPITIVDRELELVFQNSATDELISLLSKGKDPIAKPPKSRKDKLMECFARGTTVSYSVKVKTQEEPFEFDVTAVPLPSKERPDKAMEIWIAKETPGTCKEDHTTSGISEELIETSNAIIIGLDMEGNIDLFNTGASRALGYALEEVKGTSWFDYILDRDTESGKLEIFQWSISSGFRTQYEVRVRARSGNAMVISLENTVIFDDDGNVKMVLMVGQDITTMKRLETSLRDQSEKLVEAIDEVSLYNDLMSHDIHNANAGIMGYLELLNLGGLDEEKRKNYILRALKEVKKSSSIIKDVKVMSLVRPVGETVPIDLVSTFENVIKGLSSEGPQRKIDLDIADLQVLADELIEEALTRIFGHYLMNTDHSKISINAKRDPSRSNLVPEPVHITLETDAKEITDEMIEVVFDRPKRTDLGSHGLGLYLVKRVIDRFGGMIWVERSKDGKNVEVHILLREAV